MSTARHASAAAHWVLLAAAVAAFGPAVVSAAEEAPMAKSNERLRGGTTRSGVA
eukprot:CAMPEP_0115529410 /NCGR_PEP_ID=MMETSP0271-20121206/83928_1 /TAXON_ID=71861 /ORGANISM="Scrippsiella trochoidea, Strain CCMP3099" /LENGTH=53 /DNA_ID=CAMNT_0002961433 /DNA_START=44 /DNA_END=201 /DNA_ORIENTATION=+